MSTTVKGRFADVTGTVTRDDADPAKGDVDITIAVARVDTREA
jgi:polyisoprenoid-binding protein YceI